MMPHHFTLDHHIVHQESHGSRVRIVTNADIDEAVAALKLIYPHGSVHATPIGCHHACVYTADAPASLVAGRISEHLDQMAADGDAEPGPLHPPGVRTAPDETAPDYFGPNRGRR
jgi:hypothetical protein